MIVYITKYAFTSGIQKVECDFRSDIPNMVTWQDCDAFHYHTAHGEGRQWHRTLESAQKRAEEMRKAKIKSLKKSLAKLEEMDFSTSTSIGNNK